MSATNNTPELSTIPYVSYWLIKPYAQVIASILRLEKIAICHNVQFAYTYKIIGTVLEPMAYAPTPRK